MVAPTCGAVVSGSIPNINSKEQIVQSEVNEYLEWVLRQCEARYLRNEYCGARHCSNGTRARSRGMLSQLSIHFTMSLAVCDRNGIAHADRAISISSR